MSRFGASKFRNALPTIPPPAEWYRSTLPPSSGSITNLQTSTFSSEVKANHLGIVTVTATGDVSWREYGQLALEGEDGVKRDKVGGAVGDWDLGQVGTGDVVVGGVDGSIASYRLTSDKLHLTAQTPSTSSAISSISCHPTTPSLILAASASRLDIWDLSSPSPFAPSISLSITEPKGIWSVSWSPDGRRVAALGKSGTLHIFDPRESTTATLTRNLPIQPLKPARVSWVGADVFVTSSSRTRNREYHLFSTSDKLSTVFTASLDTSTTPLLSAIDQERCIVYLAARGDMTLRQVEIGGATGYQETLHPLQSPVSAQGLAMAHPSTLDVMGAQIATILIPTADKEGEAILPLGIKVPRRQLIDFHADLYPDISGVVPEQLASGWLTGGDKAPLPMSLDPSRRADLRKQLDTCRSPSGRVDGASEKAATETGPVKDESQATTASSHPAAPTTNPSTTAQAREQATDSARSHETPHETTAAPRASAPSQASTSPGSTSTRGAAEKDEYANDKEDLQGDAGANTTLPTSSDKVPSRSSGSADPSATSTTSSSISPTAAKQDTKAPSSSSMTKTPSTNPRAAPSTSTPRTPYNPTYSRKFLSARAPLKAAYDSLPPIATLHPDSLLLHLSEHLLFFPIQGPGGRLAVHPINSRGRMPTGGQGYLTCGSEIVCFAVDPFPVGGDGGGEWARVAVAGEDGLVRVWTVGKEGVEDSGQEPDFVIKESGIDKIVHMAFHPTASGLLVVLSNDAGSANLRLFDIGGADDMSQVVCVQMPCSAAFGFAFNALGSQVAVSTKDDTILAFDPRKASSDANSILSGKAHDSPRSFQMAWIDDVTIASVGFERGSQRKINLYSLTSSGIDRVHSTLIDIAPSALFPVYDPDTHILYIWGKGERVINAYEVHEAGTPDRLFKLPGFTTSTGEAQLGVAFFEKRKVDVRKVEVMKLLRMTGRLIEEVSFSIPRNKPEYFQDDIYVDTLDTSTARLSAQEWLSGRDAEDRRISLKPDGMKLLSEAPKTNTVSKAKFVPAQDVMTEQEKKQKEMDALFAKAKMGDSSDEEDEPKRTGLDPPDDDW